MGMVGEDRFLQATLSGGRGYFFLFVSFVGGRRAGSESSGVGEGVRSGWSWGPRAAPAAQGAIARCAGMGVSGKPEYGSQAVSSPERGGQEGQGPRGRKRPGR